MKFPINSATQQHPAVEIIHDGVIEIAEANSSGFKRWKNKETRWSAFVTRVSKTHRTVETVKEYKLFEKSRQDEIKNIGCFVGGHLVNGRRKARNVLNRCLVTLDMDHGKKDLWDDFTMLYSNAAVLYSTHKHTPEGPRFRLILPLTRPVTPEEYRAVSRRIADHVDIDAFDESTSYKPSQPMYWPSTSQDGEFVFKYQDGPWLDADKILESYEDWKDSSEWPISSRESTIVRGEIKKQGDPLEKPGVIGAFCRTYSIHEVIEEYLSDVYDTCDVEDRYTYREGSTSAGLVVYDDKYAYSHHGTDPISGKLCNSFDLVRHHKFGQLDADIKKGTRLDRYPSQIAMEEFAVKIPSVKKLVLSEKLQSVKDDFAEVSDTLEDGQDNDDWKVKLDVDRKGKIYNTVDNIVIILENDTVFKDNLVFDDFEKRECFLHDLPWRKVKPQTRNVTDRDLANIVHHLEKSYELQPQKLETALKVIYERHQTHPIRNYLNALSWDRIKRIDSLLVDYLGAADTRYTRAATRKSLVAAVTRVYQPGTKFDYVLTIVGKQGIGKSTIIKKIGKDWYSDSFGSLQNNAAVENIQGVWIMEIGELAGLKKAEVDTIKHFISKQEDRYRVVYARQPSNFPRQCIFFGTTNNRDFLRDPTGNRRFWPIDAGITAPTKSVFGDLNNQEVDQIWAEAVELFRKREPLYLSKEIEEEAFKAQTEHSEYNENIGIIENYLSRLLPDDWEERDIHSRRRFLEGADPLEPIGTIQRTKVCVVEIWCEAIRGMLKDLTRVKAKELHDAMKNIEGWKEHKSKMRFGQYGIQKGYMRIKKSVAVVADRN